MTSLTSLRLISTSRNLLQVKVWIMQILREHYLTITKKPFVTAKTMVMILMQHLILKVLRKLLNSLILQLDRPSNNTILVFQLPQPPNKAPKVMINWTYQVRPLIVVLVWARLILLLLTTKKKDTAKFITGSTVTSVILLLLGRGTPAQCVNLTSVPTVKANMATNTPSILLISLWSSKKTTKTKPKTATTYFAVCATISLLIRLCLCVLFVTITSCAEIAKNLRSMTTPL